MMDSFDRYFIDAKRRDPPNIEFDDYDEQTSIVLRHLVEAYINETDVTRSGEILKIAWDIVDQNITIKPDAPNLIS